MNDASRVSFGQTVGDLDRVLQDLIQFQSAAGNQRFYCLARHILHDDEVNAVLSLDIVNSDDVGMIEDRGGPSLLREAALAVGIADFVGWKDLDGHGAVQLDVTSFVNL